MPELPEVETLCRQMNKLITGRKVIGIRVYDRKIAGIGDMTGQKVRWVRRKAKSIVVSLEGHHFLVIHLRMTGRLLWSSDSQQIPHTRVTLTFNGGSLYLIDPRRFATFTLMNMLDGRSPPLDILEDLRTPDLQMAAAKRRCPVKTLLMDQKTLGGIGNIYACEILHRAGISPWRRACDLDFRQWERVRKAAESILKKAIACRGTSISDWADLFGKKGVYQTHLRAYGREGDPCLRCGAPIIRTVLNGRGTFFCTSCQAI